MKTHKWERSLLLGGVCGALLAVSTGALVSGAQDSSSLQQLKVKLTQYEKRPSQISGDLTPLNKKVPGGKSIVYVTNNLPGSSDDASYFTPAADKVGWTTKTMVADLASPEASQGTFAQAVALHPYAIVETGFTVPQIGQATLQKAQSEHIPFIELSGSDQAGNGITADLGGPADLAGDGALVADALAVNSNGKGNILWVTNGGIPLADDITNGYTKELAKVCHGCSSHTLNIPAAEDGTPAATALITGYMQAHPSTSYIGAMYGGLVFGIQSALKSAGISRPVAVYGNNPYAPNITGMIQSKSGGWAVDPAVDQNFRAADILFRIATGEPYKTDLATFPKWMLTPNNVPAGATSGTSFPMDPKYQAQYYKLWGLS